MGYVNAQIIVGRLGAEPTLKMEDGVPAARFPVGTSLLYKKNGRTYRETEWHNVVVFGAKAQEAAKSLHRGTEVYVKGPKRTLSYSNMTNVPRIRTEIQAEQIKWPSKLEAMEKNVMPQEIIIGEPPEGHEEGNVEVQTGLRIEDLGNGIITPAGGVARSNAPGANRNITNPPDSLSDPQDEDEFIAGFVKKPVDELAELDDLTARIGTGQDTYFSRKPAGEGSEAFPSEM